MENYLEDVKMYVVSFINESEFGSLLFAKAEDARKYFRDNVDLDKYDTLRDYSNYGYYFDGEFTYIKWGYEFVND